MKKVFLTVIMALGAISSMGQAPDDGAIRAEIFNPASQYYYPPLMTRYMAGDTTLTAADYHYLYYGFAMQDEYVPLDPIPGETDMLTIIERNGGKLTKESAEKLLFYAQEIMAKDPFSPLTINFMTYAYGIIGDAGREKISAARFKGILDTIEASGDGKTEKTAWDVIFFSHVNDFLASKGLVARDRRVVSQSVEYATLTEPNGKDKGYFFDFSRAYSKPPTVLPEKPKGLKPKW